MRGYRRLAWNINKNDEKRGVVEEMFLIMIGKISKNIIKKMNSKCSEDKDAWEISEL